MRVLVTGAGGFLGRRLLDALRSGLPAQGRILGIDRSLPAAVPGIEALEVDPFDGAGIAAAVAAFDPTDVVHLAALASVAESNATPALAWRADLLGSLNLAEAVARGSRAARFLYVSSTEVYGEAFLGSGAVGETVIPKPNTIYGRTKYACEAILRDILLSAGVRHAVLRPSNYIGPGQSEAFVAPSFAGQIARIEAGLAPPVLEVGDLGVRRDFIDVSDVTAACRAAIAAGAGLPDAAVFNLGSGVATPVSDILERFRGLARAPFEVRVSDGRLRRSEVRCAVCDASAFTAATGWRPRVPLADSLAAILADARATVAAAA